MRGIFGALIAMTGLAACSPAVGLDSSPAPTPMVTVTETVIAAPEPSPQELTEERIEALRQVCRILEEVPSFDALIEYEPRPDRASADESKWLSKRLASTVEAAAKPIFESGAEETAVGRWILADVESIDSIASLLKSNAERWLQEPSDENLHYRWASIGAAFHEVQRSSACTYFLSTYRE